MLEAERWSGVRANYGGTAWVNYVSDRKSWFEKNRWEVGCAVEHVDKGWAAGLSLVDNDAEGV